MDILNFISWLRGGRLVKTVDPKQSLVPVATRDNTRDDSWLTNAITVEDLGSQLASDRLVAGSKEVVLDPSGNLTFNTGTSRIQTTGSNADLYISTVGSDDIYLESGDRINLYAGEGLYDQQAEGGDVFLRAGNGSDGNNNDAGDGGDIRLYAGNAGFSNTGNNSYGGDVIIVGGYTTSNTNPGGAIYLFAGTSNMSGYGDVVIGDSNSWRFNEGDATLRYPLVSLNNLPSAGTIPGARAMINDSNVPAPGNFGAIAATGGSAIVPVFSDGVNWLIG